MSNEKDYADYVLPAINELESVVVQYCLHTGRPVAENVIGMVGLLELAMKARIKQIEEMIEACK